MEPVTLFGVSEEVIKRKKKFRVTKAAPDGGGVQPSSAGERQKEEKVRGCQFRCNEPKKTG